MKVPLNSWCMLASNYDDVAFDMDYPVYVQPKMNGICACWNAQHKVFVSRQGKVWREELLPHLYAKWKTCEHNVQGELYCHGMPIQEINARVSVNANQAHPDVGSIDFWPVDFINMLPAPRYAADKISNPAELECKLQEVTALGYEGLMIRVPGVAYLMGKRTKYLVKLKPWKYITGTITGMTEGKGKRRGMLGAVTVAYNGIHFQAGGGEGVTDDYLRYTWDMRNFLKGTQINIRYRELSNKGIPLQSQIVI